MGTDAHILLQFRIFPITTPCERTDSPTKKKWNVARPASETLLTWRQYACSAFCRKLVTRHRLHHDKRALGAGQRVRISKVGARYFSPIVSALSVQRNKHFFFCQKFVAQAKPQSVFLFPVDGLQHHGKLFLGSRD